MKIELTEALQMILDELRKINNTLDALLNEAELVETE